MDWKQSCRARLPEHLDESGDLAPPWEKFPHYERHTIGWRMGTGEDWLGLWHVFLENLDPAFEVRLAYLKRHPPAPFTWASSVHDVLYPSSREEDKGDDDDDDDDDVDDDRAATERRAALLQRGLIASDIAFATWLRQQPAVRWPWTYSETPENAARHWTRDLWFWSRQVAKLRGGPAWTPPQVPAQWQPCALALETGNVGSLEPGQGLLSLARMLSAGQVTPPWQLGLDLDEFADSFEGGMGYVDAFRLWGMSAFDDREHLQRYLDTTEMPKRWEVWVAEQFLID